MPVVKAGLYFMKDGTKFGPLGNYRVARAQNTVTQLGMFANVSLDPPNNHLNRHYHLNEFKALSSPKMAESLTQSTRMAGENKGFHLTVTRNASNDIVILDFSVFGGYSDAVLVPGSPLYVASLTEATFIANQIFQ